MPPIKPNNMEDKHYQDLLHESELVVAFVRMAMVALAVIIPSVTGINQEMRAGLQYSIGFALTYLVLFFVLRQFRVVVPGARLTMLLLDGTLVLTWVMLTWQDSTGIAGSPLFPLCYVVVIIGALWFEALGAMLTAAALTSTYLFIIYRLSGDPLVLTAAIYREVSFLFIIAILSGYLVDKQKRERAQQSKSRELLGQYQARFEAAQEVYEMLIPTALPKVPGVELGTRWRPAMLEGGGDFLDAALLPDGSIAITIADVSGKSLRGSLKLPIFKAAFQASVQVWQDPGEILTQVNRIVYPTLQPEMFISACVVIIDPVQNTLRYANAGQDPPVYFSPASDTNFPLESGGLLLGIDDHAIYFTEQVYMLPGDTLCLYTDGVTEARNPAHEEFSTERVWAEVKVLAKRELTADNIAGEIFDAVNKFMDGAIRHDDLTILVMRFQPDDVVK